MTSFGKILIGGAALCAAFGAVAPSTTTPVALAGHHVQQPDVPDDGGNEWSTTLGGGGQMRPSAPQNNGIVACTALECRPEIPSYKPQPGPEQRFAPEPEEHRSEIDQLVQRIMDWLDRLLGREVPPMPLPRPIPEPVPLPRPIPDPDCRVEPAAKGDTADSGVAVLRCPTEK